MLQPLGEKQSRLYDQRQREDGDDGCGDEGFGLSRDGPLGDGPGERDIAIARDQPMVSASLVPRLANTADPIVQPARFTANAAISMSLLEDARKILASVDRAVETSRRASRGEQGRLCVGVTSTTPFHPLVPRSIRSFCESSPMVALTLEEAMSNELIDYLRTERMDAAFIRTSASGIDGLTVHRLLAEPMILALPRAHALADDEWETKPITLKQLAGATFILSGPPGTGMYDPIIAACVAAGFNPKVGNLGATTQQAPRISSTLSLVAAGLGVTCVPLSLERMNMDGVVYRRLTGSPQFTAVMNLATRQSDPSSVLRKFVRVVREVFREGTA